MNRRISRALMALIAAPTIIVTTARAQAVLTVDVSFDFTAGEVHFPAGVYTVREIGQMTLIQRRGGDEHILGLVASLGPSDAHGTTVVFDRIQDRFFLREIWAGANGRGLLVPESKLEKEMRASNSGAHARPETITAALR